MRVTMYPPSASETLSPYRAGEGIVRCSQVDQLLLDSAGELLLPSCLGTSDLLLTLSTFQGPGYL